ncbi:MAG: HIT family protein [Betaproteobacteria bacterium]|nr:HIT family protein [Betaproteobacteria bacterium]
MTCDLCDEIGGALLWQDPRLRVVYVDEPGYTGYCRVIWNTHVAEMTDLTDADRARCMHVVFTVEALLRELIAPDKINLASLGNFTPHVHWHVIARYRDDAHFPQAIWGRRQRADAAPRAQTAALIAQLQQHLRVRLNQ